MGGQAATELLGAERVAGGSQEVKCGGRSVVASCRINQMNRKGNSPISEEELPHCGLRGAEAYSYPLCCKVVYHAAFEAVLFVAAQLQHK